MVKTGGDPDAMYNLSAETLIGKIVFENEFHWNIKATINMQNLPNGIYLLGLANDHKNLKSIKTYINL